MGPGVRLRVSVSMAEQENRPQQAAAGPFSSDALLGSSACGAACVVDTVCMLVICLAVIVRVRAFNGEVMRSPLAVAEGHRGVRGSGREQ